MKFFKALYNLFFTKKVRIYQDAQKPFAFSDFFEENPDEIIVKVCNFERLFELGTSRYTSNIPTEISFDILIYLGEKLQRGYRFRYSKEFICLDNEDYSNMSEGSKVMIKRIICAGIVSSMFEMDFLLKNSQKFRLLIPAYDTVIKSYLQNANLQRELKDDPLLRRIISEDCQLFLVGAEVLTSAAYAGTPYAHTSIKEIDLNFWHADKIKQKNKKKKETL